MKKVMLVVLGLMFVASAAMAYDFGYIKIDPNVSMQKEVTSPWFSNKRPIFFGDKPEAALAWNKKDATHGVMQLGIDASGQKVLMITPKQYMGMPIASPLTNDFVGFGALYSDNLGVAFGINGTEASLTTGSKLGLRSTDDLTLTSTNDVSLVSEGENVIIEGKDDVRIDSKDGGVIITADAAAKITLAGVTDVNALSTLTLTQADLTSTCTTGQLKLDNGGATNELCYCQATDTWLCAPLAAGPTD